MIQFNLLPDVKIAFIKARRQKRLVMLTAMLAGSVALVLTILLFLEVNVRQKEHLSNLDKDIASAQSQITGTQDIDKVLTVQNQLNSLPALHSDKTVSSRVVNYLQSLVPSDALLQNVQLNFLEGTIDIAGQVSEDTTSDKLAVVNEFVDVLKFTTFTVPSDPADAQPRLAFSDVVLASFNRSDTSSSFQVQAVFDAALFSNVEQPTLTVQDVVSARAQTEEPSNSLFVPNTPTTDEGTQ